MTMKNIHMSMERHIASWFKQLDKSAKKAHQKRKHKPFVTISRECGAYGATIAEMLDKHLNKFERRKDASWAAFDEELIEKVLDEHGFPDHYKKYYTETAMPTVQGIIGELLGAHPPRETMIRKMSETIFRLAQSGYVILVGRGSNIITHNLPKGVHVRLIASFDKRLIHMEEYLEIGKKKAADYIMKEDAARRKFVKRYFHKDISDPSLYDIVINLDTVPLKDAVRIIGEMVFKGKGKTHTGRKSSLK